MACVREEEHWKGWESMNGKEETTSGGRIMVARRERV